MLLHDKQQNVNHSRNIMNCFSSNNLPVLTYLAQQYAVCDRWFASLPGPTVPNRLFAHFGTSFSNVDNSMKFGDNGKSIYSRLMNAGRSTKIYYFDEKSASVGFTFLLQNQPANDGYLQRLQVRLRQWQATELLFRGAQLLRPCQPAGLRPASGSQCDCGGELYRDVYNHIRQSPSVGKHTSADRL